jgi:hypothetical protein
VLFSSPAKEVGKQGDAERFDVPQPLTISVCCGVWQRGNGEDVMTSKIFAGFIVAFWVAMMAALVRVEIFPRQISVDTVPRERVIDSIFANPEPQQLNVFYQNKRIGFCRVEIPPEERLDGNYKVYAELKLDRKAIGARSQMWLRGNSTFDAHHELKNFDFVNEIAGTKIHVSGDDLSQKVNLVFEFGEVRETHQFDFNDVRGAGFANAFGLAGLANFGFLGGGMALTPGRMNTTTRICHDLLPIGDIRLPTYLIDSRLDENLWAKLWISEVGEVMKVETSMGLTMKREDW